jgi:hypothetical protein
LRWLKVIILLKNSFLTNKIKTMPASRRTFIKKTTLAAAASTLFFNELFASTKSKELTGVQLYSVRDDMKKDTLGTLRQLSKMGYKNVEHAIMLTGNFMAIPLRNLKKYWMIWD